MQQSFSCRLSLSFYYISIKIGNEEVFSRTIPQRATAGLHQHLLTPRNSCADISSASRLNTSSISSFACPGKFLCYFFYIFCQYSSPTSFLSKSFDFRIRPPQKSFHCSPYPSSPPACNAPLESPIPAYPDFLEPSSP